MAEAKVYGFEEVMKHNIREDCWIIIFRKVYDVTAFMEEHPGGDEVLLAVTGKDATTDFEDIGHSKSAKEMMANYYIGDIDPSTTIAARRGAAAPPREAAASRPDAGSGAWITVLQLVVPVLLLVSAFALQKFTKSE